MFASAGATGSLLVATAGGFALVASVLAFDGWPVPVSGSRSQPLVVEAAILPAGATAVDAAEPLVLDAGVAPASAGAIDLSAGAGSRRDARDRRVARRRSPRGDAGNPDPPVVPSAPPVAAGSAAAPPVSAGDLGAVLRLTVDDVQDRVGELIGTGSGRAPVPAPAQALSRTLAAAQATVALVAPAGR